MRILLFAPFFPPDPTGSSMFAFQQARHLRSRGHEVLVVSNVADPAAPPWEEDPDLILEREGVPVVRLRNKRVSLGAVTWNYRLPLSSVGLFNRRARRMIREFRTDSVIIHSTLFDLSVFALAWAAIRRKPNLIVCHTALWHDSVLVRLLMLMFGCLVLRPLCKLGKTRVVCVDKFTHDNARRVMGRSLDYSVIPVSVDVTTVSHGNRERVMSKYQITGSPILLSLGHVIPLRNRVNLINALPELVSRFPEIKVVVVGMIKDETAISLADQLGVRSHLLVTGAVPHAEIADFLSLADVEAHDLNGLGLGITSVEAMAAGTPIVAWVDPANYPALDRSNVDQSGFVDAGDPLTIANAISAILEDESHRETVIKRQKRIVEVVFSEDSVNSQYLKLLQ